MRFDTGALPEDPGPFDYQSFAVHGDTYRNAWHQKRAAYDRRQAAGPCICDRVTGSIETVASASTAANYDPCGTYCPVHQRYVGKSGARTTGESVSVICTESLGLSFTAIGKVAALALWLAERYRVKETIEQTLTAINPFAPSPTLDPGYGNLEPPLLLPHGSMTPGGRYMPEPASPSSSFNTLDDLDVPSERFH